MGVDFVTPACLIGVGVTCVWLLSLPLRNAAIIDVWWGCGFVFAALASAYSAAFSSRSVVVLALVTLWGGRLSAYLFVRNHVHGHGEDARYAKMRVKTGADSFWWRSVGLVFAPQAIVQFLVATPLFYAVHSTTTGGGDDDSSADGDSSALFRIACDAVGVFVWSVGWWFEVKADIELAAFKADPSNGGKLLTTGVWSVTRHPNYFGSALIWWGLWLLALPAGWWTVLPSPVLMTYVLRNVTGVAMLERHSSARKPGFEEYAKRVPPFVPSAALLLQYVQGKHGAA